MIGPGDQALAQRIRALEKRGRSEAYQGEIRHYHSSGHVRTLVGKLGLEHTMRPPKRRTEKKRLTINEGNAGMGCGGTQGVISYDAQAAG
jgi:hypothetical protein